jgi:hypothetical protein
MRAHPVDEIAQLPAHERAEIFQETAARKSIASVVAMEKDFWVCWILRRTFEPSLVDGMVFKGGTSLSKAYGLIARFSEDIDLSIPRSALGFEGDRDLAPGMSRTRASRLLDDMRAACETYVEKRLRPELHERIRIALGPHDSSAAPHLTIDPDDPGTLFFTYPPALSPEIYGAGAYILPMIRLEFGARNEVWPAERHLIQPYCLEVFPTLSQTPGFSVSVLAAERTFWEKVTLLHAEFYRPPTSRRSERVSRHYADVARLARGAIGNRALAKLDLLQAVATHKSRYFPAAWARYDEAADGNLRLVPHQELEAQLRTDYARTREMFFEDPETFDAILTELEALEIRIKHARRREVQHDE